MSKMMSRAAYMMQDHIRNTYSYITDVCAPNTFLCRGRLSFPQGLTAIALWFHRKTPADLYAHPYFIEKQSNPNQPSPQMHTTEEVQGIIKVMQGLRYMRDDFSKLDNTMCVVTDYLVPAQAMMLVFDLPEKVQGLRGDETAFPSRDETETETDGGAGCVGGVFSRSTASHTSESLHETPYKPSRVRFPTTHEAVSNAAGTQGFFRAVLHAYQASLSNASPISGLVLGAVSDQSNRMQSAVARYATRKGGYTVLYNPCELNERTFAELLLRLEREERVVKAVVVPTRQTWRALQVWADAFPEAVIVTSGAIPTAAENACQPPGRRDNGHRDRCAPLTAAGYRDFGGGVMGISFPEVEAAGDPETSEKRRSSGEKEEKEEKKAVDRRGTETAPAPHRVRTTQPVQGFTHGEDLADVLWEKESSHMFAYNDSSESAAARFGLRHSDAHRVRDLSKEGTPASVKLTPRIELLHVPGDAITDEYALYDHHSKHLACVDLFHGEYSDFDALNTWLCRVWFKFMKRGNHKRTDLVPRFKWRQVCEQGTLPVLQRWLDELTRRREIRGLMFAHGTTPLVESPVNHLREQWNLPPLTREQLRRAAGRTPSGTNADASSQKRNSDEHIGLGKCSSCK